MGQYIFTNVAAFPLTLCRLLALIELASECYECDRLVICLDRQSNDLRKSKHTPHVHLILIIIY